MRSIQDLTHNVYLKHKEYFDNTLISLLERLSKQIDKLKSEAEIRQAFIFDLKGKLKAANLKIKDQKAIIGTITNNKDDYDLLCTQLQKENESLRTIIATKQSEIERFKGENSAMK